MPRLILLLLCLTCGGCALTKPVPYNGPVGYRVDPALHDGEALLTLMRTLIPRTPYINIGSGQAGGDESYDYLTCGVSWGIEHGFEAVYHQYVIFAKQKDEDWSKARAFEAGELSHRAFNGPIKTLEVSGRELKKYHQG